MAPVPSREREEPEPPKRRGKPFSSFLSECLALRQNPSALADSRRAGQKTGPGLTMGLALWTGDKAEAVLIYVTGG
jgi:hypothetical protein